MNDLTEPGDRLGAEVEPAVDERGNVHEPRHGAIVLRESARHERFRPSRRPAKAGVVVRLRGVEGLIEEASLRAALVAEALGAARLGLAAL